MKNFLLFSWKGADQRGGMSDFVGDYETIDQAKKEIEKTTNPKVDHYQVLDFKTGIVSVWFL